MEIFNKYINNLNITIQKNNKFIGMKIYEYKDLIFSNKFENKVYNSFYQIPNMNYLRILSLMSNKKDFTKNYLEIDLKKIRNNVTQVYNEIMNETEVNINVLNKELLNNKMSEINYKTKNKKHITDEEKEVMSLFFQLADYLHDLVHVLISLKEDEYMNNKDRFFIKSPNIKKIYSINLQNKIIKFESIKNDFSKKFYIDNKNKILNLKKIEKVKSNHKFIYLIQKKMYGVEKNLVYYSNNCTKNNISYLKQKEKYIYTNLNKIFKEDFNLDNTKFFKLNFTNINSIFLELYLFHNKPLEEEEDNINNPYDLLNKRIGKTKKSDFKSIDENFEM
jgi:hypothetical protein